MTQQGYSSFEGLTQKTWSILNVVDTVWDGDILRVSSPCAHQIPKPIAEALALSTRNLMILLLLLLLAP